MFVIWRGLGLLVPVILGVCTLVFTVVIGAVVGSIGGVGAARFTPHVIALSVLVSAFILWKVGRSLNNKPGRELVDPKTGEAVVLRRRHDLFFIRIEHWAVVAGVIGAWLLVGALFSSVPPEAPVGSTAVDAPLKTDGTKS